MTKRLQEAIDMLDKCVEGGTKEDDYQFTVWLDEFEISSKAALLSGRISEEQFDLLWRKYGMR